MMFSLVAGALFTASLALLDTPLVVAALWMLCAAAIATALPVEQATVAQASAGSLGRGKGLYETAALLGAVVASPVLAAVYGGSGLRAACANAAAGFILGAALVPLVVRMLGLSDQLAPATDAGPRQRDAGAADSDRRHGGTPAAPKTPDLRQGGQDRSSALSLRSALAARAHGLRSGSSTGSGSARTDS